MMSRKLASLSLAAGLMGGTALAEVPRVVVDIAPVHSLVAQVMQGIGEPDLIVQPGASPHEYSLRPSEAQALQDADIIFWIGEALTPWLGDTVQTLAPDSTVTALLETEGTTQLSFRENVFFGAGDPHEHGAHKETEEHHDHEDHDDHEDHSAAHDDDHKHDDGHAHDSHDHGEKDHDDHAEAGHHDHDHSGQDPHAWLSPRNAMTWLDVIASALSSADPANSDAYRANAAAGKAQIESLIAEVSATLEPLRDGQFVVFHDAYQYFERDFDFTATGAISLSDASDPSPARIAELQKKIAETGIDCVLAEPQFNPGLVATVLDGSEAKTGILDPLGSDLEPGPALYAQMIRNLSNALADCM